VRRFALAIPRLGAAVWATACADPAPEDGPGSSSGSGGIEFSWPERLEHESVVEFAASPQAKNLGYHDCTVEVSSLLAPFEIPPQCAGCEQGYGGGLAYHEDTCSAQAGITPPTGVRFGMRARPPDLDAWGEDEQGLWQALGPALAQDDGAWVLVRQDPVRVDSGLGQVDAGLLTSTLTFRRP
jgi:hypothetical protein